MCAARSRTPGTRSPKPDSLPQRRHLHRRQRRLESLIPHLQPGAINGLSQVFAGKHPKRMRNSSLLRRLPNPTRNFIHDHVVMRRIAAQQTSKANNCIVLPSLRQSPRRQRNLKRPRHPHQMNVFPGSARAHQPVDSAQQQPLSDKCIEPGNGNSEALARSAQRSFERRKIRLRKRLNNEILIVFFLRDSVPPW